jgi:hypothetical protein
VKINIYSGVMAITNEALALDAWNLVCIYIYRERGRERKRENILSFLCKSVLICMVTVPSFKFMSEELNLGRMYP